LLYQIVILDRAKRILITQSFYFVGYFSIIIIIIITVGVIRLILVALTCGRRTGRQLDVDVIVRAGERVAVEARDADERRRSARVLGVIRAVPETAAERVQIHGLDERRWRWLEGTWQVPATTRITTATATEQTLRSQPSPQWRLRDELVGWLSGRTSVSDRRTFTGLHRTCC